MQEEIIGFVHRDRHFGVKKTRELIEKSYHIQNLQEKIEKYVRCSLECLIIGSKRGKKEGLLMPIMAVVDGFTKFDWLYPTKSTGTEKVIDRLSKQAAIFGNPRRIVTDRGTAFTSTAFKDYCSDQGIKLMHITAGRGNGQVERIHKVVIPMLGKLCHNNPSNWYCHVDRIQQILNNMPPRTTKYSPYMNLTGLDMWT